jgi:hypothetical protein
VPCILVTERRGKSTMTNPKSRLIPLTCIVYAAVALAGLYIAVLGQINRPAPLQRIDETGKQSARLEQARQTMEQSLQQQPKNAILSEFYKNWLLESEYEELAEFTKPLFEGDSFEQRLIAYNRTVAAVDDIYGDAVHALALLSSGSLMLVLLMLWSPSYLVSALLASYPVAFVFLCVLLGINCDPVFTYWAPFPVLGGIIFVLQLIFALRFGRPEHRTAVGLPGLIVYRRGLVLTNLGLFLLIGALLMAAGSLTGEVHSAYARFGLMLFGEGGIVLFGLVGAMVLIPLGVRDMNRKPASHVDSTSS